ncbi:autotransporter-associated beta strand repeat-containing protein [Humisphaera borealis]|uniref:Autotransporter-associated beta strand repeat-containing protein n=1 Tax=Humisphaera borealis TaxID=2807512 RepID=A0A7M2WZ03_9BACT|nr:autotransporter-associated beta strand repeat-containing protein [Humisphaera borealis]QOV90594.1 autotransporter-associated beta strand repeat-containing protein [Humisphaera borealis]
MSLVQKLSGRARFFNRIAMLSAAVAGAMPTSLLAADKTWNGTTSNAWNDSTNWTDAEPTSADRAIFPLLNPVTTPASGFVSLTSGRTADRLQFLNTYNLRGGDLTLASGQINVETSGAVYGQGFTTATIASALQGTSGVTKDGGGTLVLAGRNTFSGNVAVSSGTLTVINDINAGAAANTVNLNGGRLELANVQQNQVGEAFFTFAHVINVGAGGGTLSLGSPLPFGGNSGGATLTANNAITGAGVLTKAGGGRLFMMAANTSFTGELRLGHNSGQVDVRGAGTLMNASKIVVEAQSFFNVDNNSTLAYLPSAATINDRLGNATAIELRGGRFMYLGRNTSTAGQNDETIGAVTLKFGQSEIRAQRSGGGGANLTLTSLTHTSASATEGSGVVRFSTDGTGGLGQAGDTGRIFITGQANDSFLGGWALVNSTDFANYRTATGVAQYGATGYTAYGAGAAATDFVAGRIVNQTANVTLGTAGTPANFEIQALRMVGVRDLLFANATDRLYISSGGLLTDGSNSVRNVGSATTRGELTAGPSTGASGAYELFLHNNSNTTTIHSVIVDNGASPVAVVKSLDGGVSLTAVNTYTGGTNVLKGTLTAAAAGSLGSGDVRVKDGRLTLNQIGSVSGSTGKYTVETTGEIFLNYVTNPSTIATERFDLGSSAVLIGRLSGAVPAANAGMNGLTRVDSATFTGTPAAGQVLLAPDAIVGHNTALNSASNGVNDGTIINTIANLGSNADLFFGLSNDFNAGASQGVTLGVGTPWKGMSTDRTSPRQFRQGTITLNSDVIFQGLPNNNTYSQLLLGDGTSATNGTLTYVNATASPVKAFVHGRVDLNEVAPTMPSSLTWVVTPGGFLSLNQASVLGSDLAVPANNANILVQAGGTVDLASTAGAAINGNVVVEAGGVINFNDNVSLTGAGTVTVRRDGVMQIQNTDPIRGTQPFVFEPRAVIRLVADSILGLSTRLSPSATYVTYNANRVLSNQATPENLILGNGGVLTNDSQSDRTASAGFGQIVVGSGGVTFAASSGTRFRIQEDYALGANTLTIGLNDGIDGNHKLGTLSFNAGGGTGLLGSVIDVTTGATLQLENDFVIPNVTRVNLQAGSTLDVNNRTELVGSLTGAGTVLSSAGGSATFVIGADNSDATFAGAYVTGAQQVNLYKTGTGRQDLTGVSTTTANLHVNQGTIVFSGLGTGLFANYQVNRGGTLLLDNAATPLNNRLGSKIVRAAGGTITVNGHASTAVSELVDFRFDGGGAGVLNLNPTAGAGVTLSSVTLGARSISTLIVRGNQLGATPGANVATFVATTTSNAVGGNGQNAYGLGAVSIRPDILTDTPSTGGTAPLSFVTQPSTTSGFRALLPSEYASIVRNGDAREHLLVASNTTFTPTTLFNNLNYADTNNFETSIGSVTVEPGVAATIAPVDSRNIGGGRNRLVVSSGGFLVRDNGSLTINAAYLDNSNYYFHVNGASGTATVNATILGGGLTKSGSGKLTLGDGAIRYLSGNFSVNEGTLELGANNAPFTNTGTSTIATTAQTLYLSNGTLDLKGNSATLNSLISSNSTNLNVGTGGTLTNTSVTPANVTVYQNGQRFAGNVAGNINVTKSGTGNWEVLDEYAYTGTTTVRGGGMVLRERGRLLNTTAIDLRTTTLTLDLSYWNNLAPVTNRIPAAAPLTMRGSTLEFRGFDGHQTTQTVNSITIASGANYINSFPQWAGSAELSIGNLSRGGTFTTVDFRGNNGIGNLGRYGPQGFFHQDARILLGQLNGGAVPTANPANPATTTNGFFGAWAVVNEDTFATYVTPPAGPLPTNLQSIGGVVGYGANYGTGATSPAYVSGVLAASYSAAAGNVNIVDVSASFALPAGNNFVGAMRLSGNTTRDVTFAAAGNILNIESGGLVRSNNNNGTNIGTTAVRGVLTAGGAAAGSGDTVPLYAHFNQGTNTIHSVVADPDADTKLALVKSLGGNLVLTATNTYTGPTVINGGRIVAATTTAADGTSVYAVPTDVTINGGSTAGSALQLNASRQIRNGINITFNGGGFLDLPAVDNSVNEVGNLTVNWDGASANNFISAQALVDNTTLTTKLIVGGNITVTNDVLAHTPTIPAATTANTARVSNILLEFTPGAHTIDTSGTGLTGLALTANMVNSAGVTLNKTGPTMLILNAPGLASVAQFAGVMNVNNGQVRLDNNTTLAATSTLNVAAGAALIGNVNGNPIFNATINGGVLGTVANTMTIGSATSTLAVTAPSEVRLHDFYQLTTGRQIVINSIVSGAGALSIVGSEVAGQNNSFTLTNAANTYGGAITVNTNVNLISQSATKVGSAIGTATIELLSGELRIRDNGTGSNSTLAYGNAINVAANARPSINIDRVDANTNNTIALGALNLGASSTLTVNTANGYGASFTGTTVPASGTVTLNSAASINLGSLVGGANVVKSNAGTVSVGNIAATHSGSWAINGGTVRLTAAGNPLNSNPISIRTSGALQADPGTGTLALNQNLGNVTGTLRATSGLFDLTAANGTGIIQGAASFTANGVAGQLREGRLAGAADFTTPNPANFGLSSYPRMGQTNAVTQNAHTGWQDNTTWVYTGQFFDADGSFAFAETIDDSVQIRIDGVVRLQNGTYNVATTTGSTAGMNPTGTAAAGANASGGTTNFGMGPLADGWHDFEIRVGNGTGGGGPFAMTGFSNFYGIGFYDGTDPAKLTTAAGTTYERLDELLSSRFRTTEIGGTLQADAGAELKLVGFVNMEALVLNGAAAHINITGTSGVSNANWLQNLSATSSTMTVAGTHVVSIQNVLDLVAGSTTVKEGTGTLELKNVVSVAGRTGGITVNNGTLRGTGTVLGPVTIAAAGTLSPGFSAGLLSTGALTLAADSDLVIELNGTTAGTQYDQVNVTGAVNLTGANLALSLGFTPAIGTTFTIIANDQVDPVVGEFVGLTELSSFTTGGVEFSISYAGGTGNDVVLTAIPEPATAGIMALAGLGLLSRRRRRCHR